MILGRDPESFRLPSKGRTVNICHSSKYASFLSKYTCTLSFYRPQTKFAKVMFLHLSVSHSVHGGGVVSQHALQVSRPTPRGEVEGYGLGGSPGPHQGGSPGPHWVGGFSRPTPREVSRPTPRGVSQHALQVSRPTPRGEVEGYGLGGSPGPHPGGSPGPHWGGFSRPTPSGVSRPTPRGVSQHALQVSRPTPRGEVEGSGLVGVSQHALRQTPPNRRLLLRAVRILLECILVFLKFESQ